MEKSRPKLGLHQKEKPPKTLFPAGCIYAKKLSKLEKVFDSHSLLSKEVEHFDNEYKVMRNIVQNFDGFVDRLKRFILSEAG